MTEQEYQKYLKAQRNYSSARIEILLIIIMTIVNIFLLPSTGTYYVCSISLATFYIVSCLIAQEDPSRFGITAEEARQALPGAIIIAVIIVALYILFFFLSKKKKGCLTTLLVFVSIDTFFSLLNAVFTTVGLLDIVIHAISIYMLAKGISSAKILQEHFAKGVAVSAKEIRGYFEESQRQKADEAINRAQKPQLKDDPFGYGTPAAQQTTAQQQANVITNCPACGARRNGTDKFCPYCGTPYEAAKTDIQATAQPATTEQPTATATTEQPTSPPASQNSSDDNSDNNEDLA